MLQGGDLPQVGGFVGTPHGNARGSKKTARCRHHPNPLRKRRGLELWGAFDAGWRPEGLTRATVWNPVRNSEDGLGRGQSGKWGGAGFQSARGENPKRRGGGS